MQALAGAPLGQAAAKHCLLAAMHARRRTQLSFGLTPSSPCPPASRLQPQAPLAPPPALFARAAHLQHPALLVHVHRAKQVPERDVLGRRGAAEERGLPALAKRHRLEQRALRGAAASPWKVSAEGFSSSVCGPRRGSPGCCPCRATGRARVTRHVARRELAGHVAQQLVVQPPAARRRQRCTSRAFHHRGLVTASRARQTSCSRAAEPGLPPGRPPAPRTHRRRRRWPTRLSASSSMRSASLL